MSEEKLRDELLAWQEGQRELHRWKLVAVGGLAALGLGLTSEEGEPQILVICLAPFIVAYCDALLRDYDLRIGLVGFFLLLKKGGVFSEYEGFLEDHPVSSSSWWYLGGSASVGSSLATCVLTALAGVYGFPSAGLIPQSYSKLLLSSAAIGALLVIWIHIGFRIRYGKLREAVRMGKSSPEPNLEEQ